MWWLVGCGPDFALSDVPIVGGTAYDRAAVAEDVRAWDDAVGPGRVRLREIRLTTVAELSRGLDFQADAEGVYHRPPTRIEVAMDGSSVEDIVWHELCHALVDQDGIARREDGPVAELERELFDPADPSSLARSCPDCYPDADQQWSEAVARACGPGPLWAAAAAESRCAARGPRADLAEWLRDRVWSAFEDPYDGAPASPQIVFRTAVEFEPVGILPTVNPRAIAVLPEPGVRASLEVELYGGAAVVPEGRTEASAVRVPAGSGMWAATGGAAGWPEGPAAIVGGWRPLWPDYHLAAIGGTHLAVHDRERWRFVGDGCAGEVEWLFTADNALWAAGHGDGEVWWELLDTRYGSPD